MKMRGCDAKIAMRAVLIALLWALSAQVFALGLGQLEVKSKPGQPLVAEIPIISSDPTELQGLQARLASPETFRRIGLQPPQGLVSGLQFTPAVDGRGRPIIRVTSSAPVEQAGLTFLVEVDWGRGRLVREYSALVAPPTTVAAPVAPQLQDPVAAPPQAIQRPSPSALAAPAPPAPPQVAAQPPAAPTPAQQTPVSVPPPAASRPAPPPAQSPPQRASQPPPQPVSQPPLQPAPQRAQPLATPAPKPVAPAPPRPAPASPPPTAASTTANYEVKRGDTLARIAGNLPGTEAYSLNQTMLALVRANPDAFIGEDINRLREGAVLRTPGQDELNHVSAAQAAVLVREQVSSWRDARRPQAQPAAAATAPAAPARPRETPAPASATPKRSADARLEIAPPSAGTAKQAGTQSGAAAGGEGDMLRQELQQTRETLAARDAEVRDLKERVAELEQLQKDQQRLMTMKDNAMAGAQQRQAATVPAASAPPEPAQASMPLWWWLVPAALVLAGLVWWLSRRRVDRSGATNGQPRISDAYVGPSAAAGRDPETARDGLVTTPPGEFAATPAQPASAAESPAPQHAAEADRPPAWAGRPVKPLHVPSDTAQRATGTPTWVTGQPAALDASGAGSEASEVSWQVGRGDALAGVSSSGIVASGRERIDLARAYADLGDYATARTLLQQVIDSGDAEARQEAARVLQSLR